MRKAWKLFAHAFSLITVWIMAWYKHLHTKTVDYAQRIMICAWVTLNLSLICLSEGIYEGCEIIENGIRFNPFVSPSHPPKSNTTTQQKATIQRNPWRWVNRPDKAIFNREKTTTGSVEGMCGQGVMTHVYNEVTKIPILQKVNYQDAINGKSLISKFWQY